MYIDYEHWVTMEGYCVCGMLADNFIKPLDIYSACYKLSCIQFQYALTKCSVVYIGFEWFTQSRQAIR